MEPLLKVSELYVWFVSSHNAAFLDVILFSLKGCWPIDRF